MHYGLRRLSGFLGARKPHRHRSGSLGLGVQPEVGGRDQAQSSQRTREELGEIVAGHVLDDLAAGLRYRSVRKQYGYADYKVSYGPVAQSPRTRGVSRDDSSDRGPLLRWVDAEDLVGAGELLLQGFEFYPALDPDHLILGGVLYDLVPAGGAHDEI